MSVFQIKSHEVLVDDEDDHIMTTGKAWGVYRHGTDLFYVKRHDENDKTEYLHRVVMDAGPGQKVDHINHNGKDNRRSNLRWATTRLNIANKRSFPGKTTSQYKGVYFHGNAKNWHAQIKVNYKRKHLGCFAVEEDAARAYDAAALEAWGEFAQLNFAEVENVETA